MLESCEPRIVLAGVPELIEINSLGASDPEQFTRVGETVFFTADDGVSGTELWKTDGTPQGTTRVRDIRTGSGSSNPTSLTEFNGLLYFVADDGETGKELWSSDGTESGTVLVRDINPGTGYQYPYGDGNLQSAPTQLTSMDGTLFFRAIGQSAGAELWRSDGTSVGTMLVKDIFPGDFTDSFGTYPNASEPQDLTVVNGTLYFTADDGASGRELWRSDGTSTGTVMVRDLFEGSYPYYYDGTYYGSYPNSSRPGNLTAMNGQLFFTATDGTTGAELWVTDGTSAGTVLVKDIQPGGGSSFSTDHSFLAVGDRLYFTAETDDEGKELWITDGTAAGTVMVDDIRPGTVGSITNAYLTELNGRVYFAADDGVAGTELWATDGTQAGTARITNLADGGTGSFPRYLTAVDGKLYFSAFTSTTGRELWESDGTATGTEMVSDLLAGTASSSPRDLSAFGQSLVFSADNGTSGRELYVVSTIGDAIQAKLTIYVDGQPVAIPANIGVDSNDDAISQIRSLGGNGDLIIEPIAGEPITSRSLEDFFETWRTNAGQPGNNADALFDSTNLLGNTVDQDHSVQMFVNGQLSTEFESYQINHGDEIVLVYGDNPVVSLNTNFGSVIIELFEDETPITVDNFLNYVNDGDYVDTFIHRSVPGFVIQGGGFRTTSTTFTGTSQFSPIQTDGQIQNEPGISNTRGTVAMAKVGGNPNSATSQFFVNLSDSNAFLDLPENNSFTVFGQVLDMSVVDDIESIPVDKTNPSPYGELPLTDDDELVVIQSVAGEGEVRGAKFLDVNADGAFDASDSPLENVRIYVDVNNNSQFDTGEIFTLTDANGEYLLRLPAGDHRLRADVSDGRLTTQPSGEDFYDLTVEIGRAQTDVDFGEATITAPSAVDLVNSFDTGVSPIDQLTNRNNSSPERVLQFEVLGVVDGATVEVFADGTLIGTGVAAGNTAVVTTDGTTALADGMLNITARQIVQGNESPVSSAAIVIIDATPPATIASTPPDAVRYDETYTFDADSPDEGSIAYTLSSDAPQGMTIDSGTGVVTWSPTVEQAVPQSFEILVTDAAGNVSATQVNLNVLGVIPALEDTYDATEDTTLTVTAENGVLANDGDSSTGTLTATLVDGPSHGQVTLNSDGSFSYTPDADFFGEDEFTYVGSDGVDASNVARVTITVAGVNDPIATAEDSYTTAEDTPLTVTADLGVLANDVDPDNDNLVVSLANQPTSGTLVLNEDGSFTYTPDADFFGTDSFAYRVSDGVTTSDTVAVQLTVTAVDDTPTAVPDNYSLDEDTTLTVGVATGVAANDSDPDGDITVSLESGPSHGVLTLNADGSFSYTPDADYAGTDQFVYRASDGTNVSTATVTLNVADQPDAPTAVDDTFSTANTGQEQSLDVLGNDSTIPDLGDSLQIVSVGQTSNGGTVRLENGTLFYAPASGFIGTETFQYTVEDADGLTDTASVTVTVEDSTSNVISGFVYLDDDGDGTRDAGELGIPGSLIHLTGTSSLGEAVSLTTLTGDDGFYQFADLPAGTYQVSQTQPAAMMPDSTSATSGDAIAGLVLGGGQTLSDNNFSEVGFKPDYMSIAWFFASSTDPAKVMRHLMAAGEERAGNEELADAIREGGNAPTTPTNRAPVASLDSYAVDENATLTVSAANGVLANDVDADGDPLTATVVETTDNGQLTLNANGSFTYVPSAGFTGTDLFTYRVSDGTANSNVATVTITVRDVANTFSLDENSANGTLVGQVDLDATEGTLSFAFEDDSLPDDLALRPDDHLSGNPSSPLVLIEYLDLQCPICQTFHPIVEDLEDEFEDELLVVRRHLPLTSIHPNAFEAAIAAEAAGRQGQFDEMVDLMFENQDDWENASDPGSFFETYATQLGLNLTQFRSDLEDPAIEDRIQRDLDAADRLGATGTPTFYLNGELLDNTDAQADFEDLIDEALADFDAPFVIDRETGEIRVADSSQLDFETTPSFTLTVVGTDVDGNQTTREVVINLVNVNEAAPTAFADTYDVAEGGTLTVSAAEGVLANDTDADGDPLTAVVVNDVNNGTLTLNDDGSFTYSPNAGFNGTESFTYEASDGSRTSNLATVTITVSGTNDAPTVTNDTYFVVEDTTLQVPASTGVLANDQDSEGDTLTVTLVDTTTNGTLLLNDDGSFSYTPDSGFTGSDSFTYQANDGQVSSSVATVTLTITPVNDAPEAQADSYTVEENTVLTVNAAAGVLANDSDPNGNTLSAQLITGPTNGSLSLGTDGSFVYTPLSDFNGTDTFTYQARDASLASSTTTVTITVTSVNDLPQAVADQYGVTEGVSLNVPVNQGVLANDTDPDADTLTATLVDDVSNGTLSLNADGSFTYTPNANFLGTDSFTYQADDGTGVSNTATVTLTVSPLNTFSLLENAAAGSLVGQLQLQNPDIAGSLIFEEVDSSRPTELDLAPDDHFSGDVTAPVVLIEYLDFQCPACASYHPIVEQLEDDFAGDLLVVRRHLPLTSIHANAFDAAVAAEAAGRQGMFDEMASKLFASLSEWADATNPQSIFRTYASELGLDTTQFESDLSDTALADRVQRDIDAATSLGTSSTPTFYLDGVLLTSLPQNQGEFESLIQTQVDAVDDVFVIDRLNGEIYLRDDQALDFSTTPEYTLSVRVADLDGDSEVLNVLVKLVETNQSAPVAAADFYAVSEDQVLNANAATGLLANDSDPDGDTLVPRVETNPLNGTLTVDLDGSFQYTPNADFFGTDSFTYRASDGDFESEIVTVTVEVTAVNDAPVVAGDAYSVDESSVLTVDAANGVLANDVDVDLDTLTASVVAAPTRGTLVLNADGSFSYTPIGAFVGSDSFTYQVNDGTVNSAAVALVLLEVLDVNQAPVAGNDAYIVQENQVLAVAAVDGVLANDSDADGDALIASVVSQPANGTVVLAADGTFQYTPDTDYSGTDSFTYRANDGELDSNTATVTVTVNPRNTFTIEENSRRNEFVGQVQPTDDNVDGAIVYEFVDSNLPSLLQLVPDDHLSGDPDSPVVMIEYVDFQCPTCRAFHPVVEQLKDDFSGELLVVRRHFPLTAIHANAFDAAVAAEAAGRQGMFDEMADLLFENQAEWASEADPQSFFESYANTLGLDLTQFQTDLGDSDLAARVQRDLDDAIALGAGGTPTFYLNGTELATLPSSLEDFSNLVATEVDAVDDVFYLDRITGELTVRDATALDYETVTQLTVDVRMTDADGDSQVVTVTVNLLDQLDSAGATMSYGLIDAAMADDDSWDLPTF